MLQINFTQKTYIKIKTSLNRCQAHKTHTEDHCLDLYSLTKNYRRSLPFSPFLVTIKFFFSISNFFFSLPITIAQVKVFRPNARHMLVIKDVSVTECKANSQALGFHLPPQSSSSLTNTTLRLPAGQAARQFRFLLHQNRFRVRR